MQPNDKNWWDVVLNVIALIAAAVAFVVGIYQWRRSQAWQRAEKLDKLIETFESAPLLTLAAVVLDWTTRKIHFGNRDLIVLNDEALLALRDHSKTKGDAQETDAQETDAQETDAQETDAQETNVKEDKIKFEGEQANLRDAYDAILTFFNRLELAISTNLIDKEPAKNYFSYWLERLVTFDRHPDKNKVLKRLTRKAAVATYIDVYGNVESVDRLCKAFDVQAPEVKSKSEERKRKRLEKRQQEAEAGRRRQEAGGTTN
jgi:uncharacterized membrane protein